LGEIYNTMVIKIEWIVVLAILATIGLSFNLKFQDTAAISKGNGKELEFDNMVLTEVNSTAVVSQAFAKSGKQENGILTLEHISYKKLGENEIIANKGIYTNDNIILKGDVKIIQKGGFVYTTQEALYNPKSKIFTSPTPFVATMGENKFSGAKLDYDMQKEEAKSHKIHAVIFGEEKK